MLLSLLVAGIVVAGLSFVFIVLKNTAEYTNAKGDWRDLPSETRAIITRHVYENTLPIFSSTCTSKRTQCLVKFLIKEKDPRSIIDEWETERTRKFYA